MSRLRRDSSGTPSKEARCLTENCPQSPCIVVGLGSGLPGADKGRHRRQVHEDVEEGQGADLNRPGFDTVSAARTFPFRSLRRTVSGAGSCPSPAGLLPAARPGRLPGPQVDAQDDPPAANEYPRSTVQRFKADHPWARLHLTALSRLQSLPPP